MIPKVIHYCWFGGKPLPELALHCIDSWKKFFPDYQIVEWNESNYDVHKNTYISEAYEAKKYAFVSDYARFDILYNNGGIYFDTDVEVVQDMTALLEKGPFLGEEGPGKINTGLGFAANKSEAALKKILDSYTDNKFIDENGNMNLTTVVERVSNLFRKEGYVDSLEIQTVDGFNIYPGEYFCPKDYYSKILTVTENTYTIHHFDGSWTSKAQQRFEKKREVYYKRFGSKIGNVLSLPAFVLWQISDNGIKGFTKKLLGKFKKKNS